jgi:DNA-binding transcriptional regulator YhcF (GntR family)
MSKTDAESTLSIEERLTAFLATHAETELLSPMELARQTGLNKNTVRREIRAMARKGVVERENGAYRLKSSKEKRPRQRGQLRDLVRMLVNVVVQVKPDFLVAETLEEKVEKIIKGVKRDRRPYDSGFGNVEYAARILWGRKLHGRFVAYEKMPPDWFEQLGALIGLDKDLRRIKHEKLQQMADDTRRGGITRHLQSDPYLLGDVRDFARIRGNNLLEELEKVGMRKDDVEKLEAKLRPAAMRKIYDYWVNEMDWYQRMLTRDLMSYALNTQREEEDSKHVETWIGHAKSAYADLQAQGTAIGVEPPAMPWIEKFEKRFRQIKTEEENGESIEAVTIQMIEREEPLENAPVKVRIRQPVPGKTWRRNQRVGITWGEAKPLVEKSLVTILESDVPAPKLQGTYDPIPSVLDRGGWHVVARWKTAKQATVFLTDGWHEDFLDSPYWNWKKEGYEFAVIHWQGSFWSAIRKPGEELREMNPQEGCE